MDQLLKDNLLMDQFALEIADFLSLVSSKLWFKLLSTEYMIT